MAQASQSGKEAENWEGREPGQDPQREKHVALVSESQEATGAASAEVSGRRWPSSCLGLAALAKGGTGQYGVSMERF